MVQFHSYASSALYTTWDKTIFQYAFIVVYLYCRPVLCIYDIIEVFVFSMILVGKFSRTEVEDNIIFHIATVEPFSILLLGEAAHVRSKTVAIAEELDAPFFAVNEEVNSPIFRTELGK